MALTTTASGLQYEDTVIGEGAEATKGQNVSVHYTGWLTTMASKVPSSTLAATATTLSRSLGAGMVIKGWDEGVQGMKIGGQRTLIIPAALGLAHAAPHGVFPNATLKFDVELLGVR